MLVKILKVQGESMTDREYTTSRSDATSGAFVRTDPNGGVSDSENGNQVSRVPAGPGWF